MHDRLDLVRLENVFDESGVAGSALVKNTAHSSTMASAEVIKNHQVVTTLLQHFADVTSDVARPANDEDFLISHELCFNFFFHYMKSFFKLWPFIKPKWKLIFFSILLSFPLSAIRFSPALLIQHLTDSVLVKKDMKMLYLLPLLIIGLYVLNVAVRFGHTYLVRIANERVLRDIREKLLNHYLGLSSSFFTESSVGQLISRITNDVFYIGQGTINLSSLTREIITFTGLFIYAIRLNAKLLALSLVIAPCLIWLGGRTGRLMKGYSTKMQEANGHVYSALQEAFTGFKVVKAFALETLAFKRFKRVNDEYVRYALKGARVEEIAGPLVELMAAVAIALILYVGGRDVVQGRLTPGELMAFFTCFGLMINPIRAINDTYIKFNQAGAAADRVHDSLSVISDIREIENPVKMPKFHTAIEFKNLGFQYTPTLPWIFREVNFSLPQGKSIAIVGASGQGKSTLVNLLLRFYDSSEGTIIIDGKNIRDLSIESLRSQMALVTQDVFLFNDTIYENIAAGRANATREEVLAAAEAAFAMPFINKMPQGFETMVGDRGQKLSGGERQRVSIARAILRNAPILLLDEATSSLDSESEKAVQKALDHLMVGRTTLVIAHRLSTIKNVNQILVLSNGRICEAGTHDELIGRGGEYAKFYALLG